jgi:hypothetical protein
MLGVGVALISAGVGDSIGVSVGDGVCGPACVAEGLAMSGGVAVGDEGGAAVSVGTGEAGDSPTVAVGVRLAV